MDRRSLIASGLAAGAATLAARAARAQGAAENPKPGAAAGEANTDYRPSPAAAAAPAEPSSEGPPSPSLRPAYPANAPAETYDRGEVVNGVSDFLGVSAESAAGAIERIFKVNGRPTGYIAGEEFSAAFIGGLRYGKGLLYMKNREPVKVYWRGPSIGFDGGGNASRNFTLCYNLQYPEFIFRRFPGVEGTAYLIGGLGVNYQRTDGVTLAPIRAGVGLRLGANIGYLAYGRSRNWIPF